MLEQPATLEENVRKMIDDRKRSYITIQRAIQRVNQEMVDLLNKDTATLRTGLVHKMAKTINEKATTVVQFTETLRLIDDDIREFEDLLISNKNKKKE